MLASDEKDANRLSELIVEWQKEICQGMRCSQKTSPSVARAWNPTADARTQEQLADYDLLARLSQSD